MENKFENNFNMRLILILMTLSIGVMSFFLPIYSKSLDMNALEIAGLFSILSFTLIIIRPFIGKLIDKVGRKPILIMGILIYAISYLIFSIATTTLLIYIARAIQSVASALMWISIYTIVADTYSLNNISEGFAKVNSAKSTGNIYGCILAFLILSKVPFFQGWKILFIIFTLTALFALFKVITTFKENRNVYINLPSLKSLSMFAVIWTISSIGGILYNLAERGLYYQLNTVNDNGEIFGIYTLVCDFGVMIGPVIGGFLYEAISKTSTFYLNGAIMIIVAAFIPILLKDTIKLNNN